METPERPDTVMVATHGHCFDGLASAALFTYLYRVLEGTPRTTFTYRACDYGPDTGPIPAAKFSGGRNAILDYRYTASPAVTWYFDHHATAFATDADRADFDARRATLQGAYDPTYSSCTKLIAHTASTRYGIDLRELEPLIAWADRIDAARFSDAAAAVDRSEPVMRLAAVVEHICDDAFLTAFVPRVLAYPLSEVASAPDIDARYAPLEAKRARAVEKMRAASVLVGQVVVCDLAECPIDVFEKFATYAFFPTALYAVMLTRSATKLKVSVGYNPWAAQTRAHDIGEICKRHGGGGHPVVGAFARPVGAVAATRMEVARIVAELNA